MSKSNKITVINKLLFIDSGECIPFGVFLQRESAEGKLNAVSLYMIHEGDNRSQDDIIEAMKGLAERKREELHRLVLSEKGSVVPRECKEAFLKMSKVLNLFYRKDDGFTSHDLMSVVKSVIYEPVTLQEESLT